MLKFGEGFSSCDKIGQYLLSQKNIHCVYAYVRSFFRLLLFVTPSKKKARHATNEVIYVNKTLKMYTYDAKAG